MQRLVVCLLCLSGARGQVAVFNLSNFNPDNDTTQVQKEFVHLTQEPAEIWVANVPENVGFFIVQVHSFPYNVSLSSHRKFKNKYTVEGADVGLVSFEKNQSVFYVSARNATKALIAVAAYTDKDPIPGGCNLSFNTEYAPYQLVSYTDDLITVESQAPSAFDSSCDKADIEIEMYHLFLHENNFNLDYYFGGIESMLTADSIKAAGYKVATDDGAFKYRKLFSAYRGVGQVFAIIATYNNRSAAYVPAVTYGCDVNNQSESCNGPITPHWKCICAMLLIFGLFVNFWGHRFFRATMFLMGSAAGIFITYVILSASNNNFTTEEKTITSVMIGLIYGAVWLLVWWKFGIPILSVGLTFLMAGFLMASIVYYAGLGDIKMFRNNANFWLTFACIVVTFHTLWTVRTLEGHVFACSLLGSYATVAALNYYTGGNLQYIVINLFRRMVVEDFNMATIDPPVQILDMWNSILLVVLTTFGFYYQMKEHRGRSPFPPHRYTRFEGVNEATPLIRTAGVIYAVI